MPRAVLLAFAPLGSAALAAVLPTVLATVLATVLTPGLAPALAALALMGLAHLVFPAELALRLA